MSAQDNKKISKRKYLGKVNSATAMSRICNKVYEIDGGLEIDEYEGYEVVRRRAFFDDILMITYHKFRSVALILLLVILLLLFGALTFNIDDGEGVLVVFLMFDLPLLIMLSVYLYLGVDVITIFGKRSKAQMNFIFRKNRCKKIFEDLSAKVRAVENKLIEQNS